MADHGHAHGHAGHGHGHDSSGGYAMHHPHPDYWKIWMILCGLLAVSVAGPFLGVKIVTLMTAFGIAIVKAWMVARYFMHINLAAKYVTYMVGTVLVFMFLFFA